MARGTSESVMALLLPASRSGQGRRGHLSRSLEQEASEQGDEQGKDDGHCDDEEDHGQPASWGSERRVVPGSPALPVLAR
jgi:hypothetical protein